MAHPPRHGQVINQAMKDTLKALRRKCVIGIVGGSDFVKINEQMDGEGAHGPGSPVARRAGWA